MGRRHVADDVASSWRSDMTASHVCRVLLSNSTRSLAVTALVATIAWTTQAGAQGLPWDRKVTALSVTPAAGSSTNYGVYGVWTVHLDQQATASLDLSTEVEIRVNGVPVSTSTRLVTADPLSGSCVDGTSCSGSCGSGHIDGVFNTLLCQQDGPGDCKCAYPFLVSPDFSPPPVQTGDEIMVLLRPAPGAVPESDTSNDSLRITFDGNPTYWNRSITSIVPTPSPGGPDMWDIAVGGAIQFKGLDPFVDFNGQVHLGMDVEVQVNGTPVATTPVGFDPFPLATGVGCACNDPCATGPLGETLDCFWDPNVIDCTCNWLWNETIPGVPASTGDEIIVLLRPAPGALPELPPLPDDDEFPLVCCPFGTDVDVLPTADADARLGQNRPNPFGPSTTIAYRTTAPTAVTLEVFDVHGRRVRTLLRDARHDEAGSWTIGWNATDDVGRPVPSGTYFYRLTANGTMQTRKMTVVAR
jgi:hypothetical protein